MCIAFFNPHNSFEFRTVFPQLLVIKKKKWVKSQVTQYLLKLNSTGPLTFQHQFSLWKTLICVSLHLHHLFTWYPCTDGLMPAWKVEKLKSRGILSSTQRGPHELVRLAAAQPACSPHRRGEGTGWSGASPSPYHSCHPRLCDLYMNMVNTHWTHRCFGFVVLLTRWGCLHHTERQVLVLMCV